MAVLTALSLLTAVPFMDAALIVDSGRDIANAWAVAQGQTLPLTGPDIFGTWKLGPVWFYLLALPFALGGGVTSVALWIGLLACLKIPLAYRLGQRWYGWSGGLALASAVAIPGWNSAGSLVLAHTAVVESAVLASVLLSLRALSDPRTLKLVVAAAFLSLALHAHPTAVIVAPWLVAACVARMRRGAALLPMLAVAVAFVVPWLPMLYAEALAGWPQLEGSRRFAATIEVGARSAATFEIGRGLLTGWSTLVGEFLLDASSAVERVLATVWYVTLALAAVGLGKGLVQGSRTTQLVLLQWLGGLWFVSLLRDGMPAYMLFATFPLACWAFIDGWHNILSRRGVTRLAAALALVALVLQVAALLQRKHFLEDGTLPIPGPALADVRAPVAADGWVRYWLAASDQETAARALCGDANAAHGELAGVLALGAGVAVERACGVGSGLKLGGRDAARHIVGLAKSQARLLGVEGSQVVKGWVLVDAAQVIHPDVGRVEKSYTRYLVEDYRMLASGSPSAAVELTLTCPAGHVLAVNNLMPALNLVSVAASSGGAPLTPALVNIGATYFRCATAMSIALSLSASNPAATDVFLLRAGPVPDDPAPDGR